MITVTLTILILICVAVKVGVQKLIEWSQTGYKFAAEKTSSYVAKNEKIQTAKKNADGYVAAAQFVKFAKNFGKTMRAAAEQARTEAQSETEGQVTNTTARESDAA